MRLVGRTIELLQGPGQQRARASQFTGEWSAERNRIVRETAERYRAQYFDLVTALKPRVQGTPPERYYKSWDPTHLNEDGNALWAEALLEFLPTSRLLPRRSTHFPD